jgi:hypothetical protein
MENENDKHHIDFRRHGQKNFETGLLAPEGVEAARDEGRRMFEVLRASAPGTISYCIPSNLSRSQATRDAIEEGIAERIKEAPDGEVEAVEYAQQGTLVRGDKRYVITGAPPEPGIGFDPDGPFNKAFDALRAPLQNEEEYIARVWIARADELGQLASDIKSKYPNLRDDEIAHMQPAAFGTTPEEVAISQIEGIERVTLAMGAAHPGHPLLGTYIGHAPVIDFVAMAVLGQEMNLANFKAIGGLRNYLESSTLQVKDGVVVVASFRNRSLGVSEEPITFTSIKNRLRKEADVRKREWQPTS